MPAETHDKIYIVLLDVKSEMGRQSQMLIDLNAKVAIANGRTSKNEENISKLREWRKYVLGMAAVLILVGAYLITIGISTLKSYIKDVSKQNTKEALLNYNEQ